jgi:alpha-D-ribose 1-methylphosphonate 5-triphosphate synthase subunit PhnH
MTAGPDLLALEGGFADPARDAAVAFRAAMTALARPGTILEVAGARPPAPLSVAAGVLLLTLADAETPVHLAGAHDCAAVRTWLAFHTGAPVADRAAAAFAVGAWGALLPLSDYPAGTPEYPDRSTTLIVETPVLAARGARLTGPGIAREARLSLPDAAALGRNAARFPLGLDLFLVCGTRLAGLPRSIRIAEDR